MKDLATIMILKVNICISEVKDQWTNTHLLKEDLFQPVFQVTLVVEWEADLQVQEDFNQWVKVELHLNQLIAHQLPQSEEENHKEIQKVA